MKHMLDVDELSDAQIDSLMSRAAGYRSALDGRASVPAALAGQRVALLFAEPSTRTRLGFEVAARALGAQTFVMDRSGSSLSKGESIADTCRTLRALGMDVLVMRHHRAGAPYVAARYFGGSVVNAGDGWHAHPAQALTDLLTLRLALQSDRLDGRKVVIVGDVLHSRVARSNRITLQSAGAEVWACGPADWLRGWPTGQTTTDLEAALAGADAVMALRVQKERMRRTAFDLDAYVARYQITESRMALAGPGAFFMHPGPMNEGIEVSRDVANGRRSLVVEQVHNGVPERPAVLASLTDSAG
jgi:aspartate carbamoyltransferase catalytic subunit